jgi:hypothetical protein
MAPSFWAAGVVSYLDMQAVAWDAGSQDAICVPPLRAHFRLHRLNK